MITINTVDITGSISNPDKPAIQRKTLIDITLNPFDISASNYSDQIKLNYNQSEIVILNGEESGNHAVYFTPLYTEKINYQQWKRQINKSFQELRVE
jgi:hypothetical protein